MNTTTLLSEDLIQDLNPLYEKIISDIQEQGFAVVDDFLNDELVLQLRNLLLEKYQADQLKKSAIGNKTNQLIETEIRGDFIQWIDEKSAHKIEQAYFNEINQLIDYLNRTCFMGILFKEFHYAIYPEGTFYKRHLDTFQNDDRRVLSMVFYLNDSTWKSENGGELVIYKNQHQLEQAINIIPQPGRLVIFESQLLEHEVLPVKYGKRLSITGWLKTR
ncbi:MAG: 2OG-Fe(II) oxygenase [Bacteroidota bacterium]